MNNDISQLTASLMLMLVAAGSACDSGLKQIGALEDEGAGATETDDDGEPDDGDPGDGEPEPNEEDEEDEQDDEDACMEVDDEIECAAPQGVDIAFVANPPIEEDLELQCAANIEAIDDGYRIVLTHCSDLQGQPKEERELLLIGDWSAPELADGDQPLTQVRYLIRDELNFAVTAVYMRPVGIDRVSLLAYSGNQGIVGPSLLTPLEVRLDSAGCIPGGTISCGPSNRDQEHRIGLRIDYGCSVGFVADDNMLIGLASEEYPDTVYDVFAGVAKVHPCGLYFHELQIGIVGRTL